MLDLFGLSAPLLVAAVAATLYVSLYLTRPWYSSPVGRALMVMAFGHVIVLDLTAAVILFGDYPGREWIRAGGLWLFAAGLWYLLGVLTAVVWRERRTSSL